MHLHRFLLLLLFLSIHSAGYSQEIDLPIEEWVSKLSVKKDIKTVQLRSVSSVIAQLDSVQSCRATDMLNEKIPEQSIRYKIRLNLLKAHLSYYYKCPGIGNILDLLKEALRLAYKIEDEMLIAEVNQALAHYYTVKFEYGTSVMYAHIADETREKVGKENFFNNVSNLYHLSYALYHSREYADAIKASNAALQWHEDPRSSPEDTLPQYFKMHAWNTIGLCYEKLGKYDSAFMAFHRALKLSGDDAFWNGLIAGNKGDVYFQMGRYDSAAALLSLDVQQSLNSGVLDNAANSMQWIARIHIINNKPEEALQLLRNATELLKKSPNPNYQVNIYQAYALVFKALKNPDSLYEYNLKYQMLHDSLEKVASDNRAEIVLMRMENQEAVHQILALNKEQRRIKLIRNLILVVILLTSVVGYMFLNRSRLKMKLRQQQALEKQRKTEADYASAREQLALFKQHMTEKTSLIANLQNQLIDKISGEEKMQQISELSQQAILTDADWEKFKSLFEKVYPGFFNSLRQMSADITLAELRMAALCKLQVYPKEAANLLGISLNSVHKTRQRLRHRLSLDPDANLEEYFIELE